MNVENDIQGVTAASAARWVTGEFDCGDRVADCPQLDTSRIEVAFLNVMPSRSAYREAVERCVELYQGGARSAVAHAVGMMIGRYQRQGGVTVKTEWINWHGHHHKAARMIIPPVAWQTWCEKVKGNTFAISESQL